MVCHVSYGVVYVSETISGGQCGAITAHALWTNSSSPLADTWWQAAAVCQELLQATGTRPLTAQHPWLWDSWGVAMHHKHKHI